MFYFRFFSDQLPNDEILQYGTLTLKDKEYWCMLSSNKISMYAVPVLVKSSSPDVHTSCKIDAIYENESKFLLNSNKGSHFIVAPNRSKFNEWKNAFINTGVLGIKIEYQSDVV
jgi:hypothetical protein